MLSKLILLLYAPVTGDTILSRRVLSTSPCSVSPCERIRTKLELHDLRPVLLATFEMEHRSGGVGRPQSSALPTGVGIVNASFRPFGEEANGVGHAQVDKLPIHQGQHRVVQIAGGERHVPSQPERVEPIDPGVVARLGAAVVWYVLKLWSG